MAFTRGKRVRRFWRECKISENTSIIDVGGNMYFWNVARSLGLVVPRRIVVVNLDTKEPRGDPTGALLVHGDACDLRDFKSGQFDLAFSNSVIEHVGDWGAQQRMARELRRVAKTYWIQTPDPRFLIEPLAAAAFAAADGSLDAMGDSQPSDGRRDSCAHCRDSARQSPRNGGTVSSGTNHCRAFRGMAQESYRDKCGNEPKCVTLLVWLHL